jgi:hypothetical protein
MNMLIDRCNISKNLAFDLRAYHYNTSEVRESRDYQQVLALVSPELQGKVIFEWFGEWILQVSYIADGTPAFVVDVARLLNIQVYAPRETINARRTLFAMDRGVAWRKMLPLIKGSVWGQDMILHSPDLRDEVPVYCITFVEARYIQYITFATVIENHVHDKARLRRYLVKFALRRGILVYARRVSDAEKQLNSRLVGLRMSSDDTKNSVNPPEAVWIHDDANGVSDSQSFENHAVRAPAFLPAGDNEQFLSSSLPGQPDV